MVLNAERAAKEKRGIIHWLRPEYQNRGGASVRASRDLLSKAAIAATARPKKQPQAREDARPTGRKSSWPKTLADHVKAVEAALHGAADPTSSAGLAKKIKRAKSETVAKILEILVTLGRARQQASNSGDERLSPKPTGRGDRNAKPV